MGTGKIGLSGETVRVITWGGLGDCLMLTPILRDLKKTQGVGKLIVFCSTQGHLDVLKGNPFIDSLNDTSFYKNPIQYMLYLFGLRKVYYAKFNWDELGFSLENKNFIVLLAQDVFQISIGDTTPDLFLTHDEREWGKKAVGEVRNLVVVHNTSLSSRNHMFPIRLWDEVLHSMQDCTFLQLGNSGEAKIEGAIDLRGKTSIREALSILSVANCFVGVESFFHHAATALKIPSVILLGDSDPHLFAYTQNRYLRRELMCSPCESLLRRNPCPYGQACIESIGGYEIERAIRQSMAF